MTSENAEDRERFVRLTTEAMLRVAHEAIAVERECCALVADARRCQGGNCFHDACAEARKIAAAIRERGKVISHNPQYPKQSDARRPDR